MDELGSKAVMIGVAIFITLLIVTVVILEFEHISNIYGQVAETDISFEAHLDELDKFRNSNNEFSGLDVKNTFEKYRENGEIDVCVGGNNESQCADAAIIPDDTSKYKDKYYAVLENTSVGYRIVFYLKGS